MNSVAEEILSYYGVSSDESLAHYGIKRRSGRFPWGSGENPYQHGMDFLSRVEELKKSGWTESAENIKKEFGLSIKDYRNEKSWATYERRLYLVETAKAKKADGKGYTEIGREMGLSESTVRSLLEPKREERMKQVSETTEFLRKQVDEKGMIDVGAGTNIRLNISRERLDMALYGLQREGYEVYNNRFEQVTNRGKFTTQKVLCKPGTKYSEVYDLDRVHSLDDYISRDDGKTFEKKFHYPESMDSKRLMIRYSEDGGIDKDGIVELRRGVADLSLGESRYAQVRIMVDGKKYIKGMAIYGDDKDFPPGVDVIFNTNKTRNVAKLDVLKDIKKDPDNPFGSAIKDADQGGQYWYEDPKTGKKKLGLINKRADEGDWTDWKDALPSQFLAKQPQALIKKQLGLAKADKQAEYEEILAINNPTIKKHYLQKFAEECDSAAVHLKAAALPGQKYHVIIPINTLKENEIYAPRYENGTQLALVRYPHGGLFEIPILTVNNKNALGKKVLGTDSSDAVGITKAVADRLSGADFDGDTVMCIPTNRPGGVKIQNQKPLAGLEGFDPKIEYAERPGMKYMKDPKTGKDNTQREMGVISNLITDMTLGGAKEDELAAAVRHSMVVIDAGKHKLDYKRSEIENNIAALKKKYQIRIDENGNEKVGGASTLLSRSSGEATVDKRQGTPKVNMKGKKWYDPNRPEGSLVYTTADDLYYPDRKYDKSTRQMTLRTVDGKKITYDVSDKEASDRYTPVKREDPTTGAVTYTDKTGTIVYKLNKRHQKSTNMAETDDAYTLLSKARHPKEILYADYANSMKALANEARKQYMTTGNLKYDRKANEVYKKEVDSLMSKLNSAELNKLREREAQRRSNVEVAQKKAENPDMKTSDIKKASQQAISKYRQEVGSIARRERAIVITDREWEAIQAGAITENRLKRILDNADVDELRQRATPRAANTLSKSQISRIKSLSANNYSLAEIARKLGVSTSTVNKYLKGVN